MFWKGKNSNKRRVAFGPMRRASRLPFPETDYKENETVSATMITNLVMRFGGPSGIRYFNNKN